MLTDTARDMLSPPQYVSGSFIPSLHFLRLFLLPAFLLFEDILLSLILPLRKIPKLPGLPRKPHSHDSAIFHLCCTSKKDGFSKPKVF